jgi:hypothetical protein
MAIVQISKIQQRSGNLVDLPQLDNAEFGWATDQHRLFIGRTGSTVSDENVEVLTSYSDISFSQIVGSDGGNFNIDAATNGQVLTYIASTNTWENYPSAAVLANASFKLNLGNANSLSISGGSIGYVLETDGYGNLSWTSKGTLRANISGLSNATPIIMTVSNTLAYQNGTSITISGANGVANSNVNSRTFYVKLASNFPTTGNVELYTTQDLAIGNAAIGTSLTYTNSPNAIATTALGGGGTSSAAGSNNQIQFNNSGLFGASANLTFDGNTMVVTGIANVSSNVNVAGNINLSRQLISTQATGTAPFSVASTTRVSNLNVAYANVSDFGAVTSQNTGTFYPLMGSATSGNLAHAANANLSFNAATGNLSTTLLSVTSNANVGNLGTAGLVVATGNITGGNLVTGGTVSASGNASVLGIKTDNYYYANGVAISFSGTYGNSNVVSLLASFGNNTISTTGNGTFGNINTSGTETATRFISNIATGTAPLTVTSTTRVSNLNVSYANVADFISVAAGTGNNFIIFANAATGNITELTSTGLTANLSNNSITATTFVGALSGAATSATTAGTVTTAAQPNITSVGTLSSLAVTGNVEAGNFVGTGVGSPTISSSGSLSISATSGVTINNVVTLSTGSNTTAGNITGNWSLSTGSRLQATYADLAEYYEADVYYAPGTVLEFGGEKEVTIAEDGTTRVAGVVSTDPAYAMNAKCPGLAVALALQGRVPTKVRGTIRKGDMMVSAGNGYARPCHSPQMGTVIGKALQNFDGVEGIIEIAVGRL